MQHLNAPFGWDGEAVTISLAHGGRARFTTRLGGVSAAPFATLNLGLWTDDDPAAVAANRRRALERTGCGGLAFGRQVHGAQVVTTAAPTAAPADADAQVVTAPGVAAMVLTADCLPVALAGPAGVAMVHAGWKGLAAGVLERAVAELGETAVAAIGPAAGGCCYEVRDDVRTALGEPPAGSPAPIDLKAIAQRRLYDAGVGTVHDAGVCTICSDRALFFSHRRDGPRTGRQAGMAWR